MTFEQAVAACLRNYATFQGRATRSEYWFFQVFLLLMALAGLILARLLGTSLPLLAVLLCLLLPNVAVTVRRLHDAGLSGWFYLLILAPLGGLALLFMCCLGSDPRPNAYGPPPGGAAPVPERTIARPRPRAPVAWTHPTRIPPVGRGGR